MAEGQRGGRQPRQFVERRKRRDWVTRAISIISIAGWVLAISALLFLQTASPQGADMFTINSRTVLKSSWNTNLLRIILVMLIVVFVACAFGFCFNLLRHKRKTDRYKKSIIILGLISIAGIALFLLVFGGLLF